MVPGADGAGAGEAQIKPAGTVGEPRHVPIGPRRDPFRSGVISGAFHQE